jgi:DNA-binding GntR family transcriptional regulator
MTRESQLEDDAYYAAEQQRDMELRREFLQLTYAQLHRKIKRGETTDADLVGLDTLARELGLDVIPVRPAVQPVDYPLPDPAF